MTNTPDPELLKSFKKCETFLNRIYYNTMKWRNAENGRNQPQFLDKLYNAKKELLDELDSIMPLYININLNSLSPPRKQRFPVAYGNNSTRKRKRP